MRYRERAIDRSPKRQQGQPLLALRARFVPGSRGGFTLVELLVVIAIFLVLSGLAIMFFPRLDESQRSSLGATSLQGTLQIARMRALRDERPAGVRLFPDPNN